MNKEELAIQEQEKTNLKHTFLNNTLKEIMTAVGADCGSLFLFNPESDELVLDSFYNPGGPNFCGLKKRRGEGVSGKMADIKKPVLVKDIDRDMRFGRNGFEHYRTKSFISVPLFYDQRLLGLINLADKSASESFSEADLKIAVVIAKYSCLALESLHNYKGLKEEKDILDKQKILLEKYASVGKLAAGVVHEINNPLDGIARYTNMLLSSMDENSVAREYLTEMKKGLSRIAEITKSLLEFSYQVNNTSLSNKKVVDLHLLIEESLDYCLDKFNNKIEVKKNFQADIPKVLDFGLWHIFRNIIKNAIDAMPESGTLEICTFITDDGGIKVCIEDTGCGMSHEVKQRIFEPFFTTKAVHKGCGLGLAISKEIMDRYDGKIEVDSTVDSGTKFCVLIPKKHTRNG